MTYLENTLKPFPGDETRVDTFPDRATHTDCAEMIEVEMTNMTSR